MTARVLLALLTAASVLLVPSPASAERARVTLDGVSVRLHPGTEQVVTVNHTDGYPRPGDLVVKRDDGWKQRLQAPDGRIGYGGLVRRQPRRQGTGTTPLGTYELPWAFGTHAAQR